MSAFEPPGSNGNGNSNPNDQIHTDYPHPPGPPPSHINHDGSPVHDHGRLPVNVNHGPHNNTGHIVQHQQAFVFEGQPQPPQHPQHHNPYNGQTNGRHTPENIPGPPGPSNQPGATPTSGGEGPKGNRLRKACDSCSIRKVKCDESGPPCRACAALEIPCTRDRPSRRRGPPNRHAEAIKRRRLESPSGVGTGSFESPTSPNNVAATLASFSSHAVLNAESICPISTLELLVDDFFTYIHPLCPFPHEPSFRLAFRQREDLHNPAFLALLASMVGTLVSSFPRKPRLHLKNQHREHLFPNSISLVERCHKVAVEARGPGYLDKELTVYDAATSYFLGLSAAYTFQWRQCRLYFGETLTVARVLGAHKVKDPGLLAVGGLPTTFGAENTSLEGTPHDGDYIRQEIGRRIFWIMFVGIRSMQQLGASFGELLIPPSTPNEPYPPLPLEVDDEYIFPNRIEQQPPGIVSKLTGFNTGVKIYLTVSPLATMEMAYGIDEVFDWNRQKRVLEGCLSSVKQVLKHTPPELNLGPGTNHSGFEAGDRPYFPPSVAEYPGARSTPNGNAPWPSETPVEARRKLQYEIQKANIYASQLGTRSYMVEKYWNLQEAYERREQNSGSPSVMSSPGLIATGLDGILPKQSVTSNFESIETNVMAERESIVQDLLDVLASINQVNMEPNGGSFINKIRQIASTLIETPQQRKGPLALKSEEYLGKFLDVLMKLERISPGIKPETGEVDEEEELRNWADLRDYQMRFAQSGGFINAID